MSSTPSAPSAPPPSCSRCGQTGYHGRIAAAEIVLVNATIQHHLASGASATVLLADIRASGARSLWTSALEHVTMGVTTLDEVHRAIEPELPAGLVRDRTRPPLSAHEQPPRVPPKPPKRAPPTPSDDSDDEPGDEVGNEGGDGTDDTQGDEAGGTKPAGVPSVGLDRCGARARGLDFGNAACSGVTGVGYDTEETPRSHSPTVPMTQIAAGLIDVYMIDPSRDPWRVLVLQRAHGTRSPESWEAVHGKIDPGETPPQAAQREVREETGLDIQRLYNVMVQPFYLHHSDTVQLAIVFCAFADCTQAVTRSDEHQACEWVTLDDALHRLTWPRAIQALRSIKKLLAGGDAGPAEDVMRII